MRPLFVCHVGGANASGGFYSALLSATLTDNSGEEADTLELTFDDRLNSIATPGEGAVLQPFFGYAEAGLTSKGKFIVAGIGVDGGPGGETISISAKAADFREDAKERMTENFDDKTLKQILTEVFGRHGLDVAIDPELASIKVDYEARFDQSAFGFATELARRYNAVAKPGNGKLIFAKKGKASSVGGLPMTPILIAKSQCSEWSFDLKPRPRHGKVAAKWFDREQGKLRFETEATGGQGPIRMLPHPFKTQDEAKKAAKAEGVNLNRATGSGSFTIPGRPSANAEADVIASGFRSDINGKWRAVTVTHEFSRDGYSTSVEVEAPEEQKKVGK